jgi:hypothetical protein
MNSVIVMAIDTDIEDPPDPERGSRGLRGAEGAACECITNNISQTPVIVNFQAPAWRSSWLWGREKKNRGHEGPGNTGEASGGEG